MHCRSVKRGLGDHYVDVAARGTNNPITYSHIVWLSSIFYNACLGFIKISALALYSRLGDRTTGNCMAAIFQCSPVRAAYDVTITAEHKKCININTFYLANAAVNIATDIMTYSLPIPLVMKLKVSRLQKMSLGVILGLGLFACVSSIVRITYIPPMLTSTDPTWVISGPMYWSVIETNIGILATSIPSYKVIAKRYAPRLLGNSYSASGKRSDTRMMQQSAAGKLGSSTSEDRRRNLDDGNSSEEVLVTPPGRIGVKTEIIHQYQVENSGYKSENENSFLTW